MLCLYASMQECLLNFMYHGEVNITQEKLNHFLDLAERLQVGFVVSCYLLRSCI